MQLVKSAFYDNNFLVSGLAVVKDFLLVGDIHKGVAFVRYNVSALRGSACVLMKRRTKPAVQQRGHAART